jgi:carbamoylphosphate synthase large subunit
MKILFIGARLFDEVALYAQSRGITTILSESNPNSPNLKLADEYHIVPRGMDHPMNIALSEDVDAVVPLIGIDKPLLEIAEMKGKLEKEYNLPVIASGINATEISVNKFKTKNFLIKNNISTPESTEISKKQYENFKSKLRFPTVLKQAEGQGGVGVKIALSPEDIESYFGIYSQAMMEDFLKGAEVSVEVLRWKKKSIPLVSVYKGDTTLEGTHPLNKIRIAPVNIENLNNIKIMNIAKKITDKLDANGTTEIEFIFSEETKEINTLEMNTRPSGTRFLTFSSSNINPMHQLVNMAMGEWKPRIIEREIKQYNALEMSLSLNQNNLIQDLSPNNNDHKKHVFTSDKPWIIHGPDKASRITIRSENLTNSFEIMKNLKIME